jgi:CheY-like chemotaxis protein
LRILLAEDAPENQALILAFLADTPYQIDVAENGVAAVEKFTSSAYDLVLMDIQMPGMDGHSAARAIREWERARGAKPVPIVALTANAFKEDEQRSLEAGCTAHLTKPIKKSRLLQAIEELAKETAPVHPGQLLEERPVASVDASLKELIPAYLENRSKDVETLRRALENGDFSGIRNLAHKIKGSGGGYGFDRITTIGAAMEQAAAEADRGAIERAIADLHQYVEQVEIVYNS